MLKDTKSLGNNKAPAINGAIAYISNIPSVAQPYVLPESGGMDKACL